MSFSKHLTSVFAALALGVPLVFGSPLLAQDATVVPLTEMQGWVKAHRGADTGKKGPDGKEIKEDLVFFCSTKHPPAVETPNPFEKNKEERREEANKNDETYEVVNEPFKTLLDAKIQRTDPLFVTGEVEGDSQPITTKNEYHNELKTIHVTSIKVKNDSKNMLDVFSQPDEKSPKWGFSILPESMVTITNVVGDANAPRFYQIAVAVDGALPLTGYVKCTDLKVGHSASLLERLGRLFTIGVKTGVVAPRNAGLEVADHVVDTADAVEDGVEFVFDKAGNVVRVATKVVKTVKDAVVDAAKDVAGGDNDAKAKAPSDTKGIDSSIAGVNTATHP